MVETKSAAALKFISFRRMKLISMLNIPWRGQLFPEDEGGIELVAPPVSRNRCQIDGDRRRLIADKYLISEDVDC